MAKAPVWESLRISSFRSRLWWEDRACAYYVHTAWKQFGGVTGDLAGFFLQLCELGMVLGAVLAQRIEVLV